MTTSDALRGLPHGLWAALRDAPHRLLMLDYDGTLVPFHIDRAAARPTPGILAALDRIARSERDTIAVVSGRASAELDDLLGALPMWRVAEHGWDTRDPRGRWERHPLGVAARTALDAAERAARRSGWDATLERKRTALVLHTRGVAADEAAGITARAEALWRPLGGATTLRLDRIDGGLELRASGRDKGTAVRGLVGLAPVGTLPVFVGDDHTDEDAFAALPRPGFAIRVGAAGRPTRATGRLASCDAVPDFLAAWIRSCGIP